MIRVTVSGDNFDKLGDEALLELKPDAESFVDAGARIIRRNAQTLLSRRGTGNIVKRFVKTRKRSGRSIVFENASVPGAPPAFHLGKLQRSLKVTKPKWKGLVVTAAVGPKGKMTAIAHILEFGGRVGRKLLTVIAARPFMRPAERMSESEIDRVARATFGWR